MTSYKKAIGGSPLTQVVQVLWDQKFKKLFIATGTRYLHICDFFSISKTSGSLSLERIEYAALHIMNPFSFCLS